MARDLDDVLKGWDYDPTDERANVRILVGADGMEKIQLRVRFGVLHMHADGAPDGGGESHLERIMRDLAAHRARKGAEKGFSISAMRTALVSQDIMDHYQRRVCFFLLGDYRRAMRDAEHNLALMALLKKYSVDKETAFSHDRYRAFVIMDRARAAAMLAVNQDDLDRAAKEIDEAAVAIKEFYKEYSRKDLTGESRELEILRELKSDLRRDYNIPLSDAEKMATLKEEQNRAIAREDYEKAARLRDEIEKLAKRLSG